jgi:hypothetical protein
MFITMTDCVGTLAVLASRQMKELAFHDTNEEVCKLGEMLMEAVIALPSGVIDGIGVKDAGEATTGVLLTDGDSLGDNCDAGDQDTLDDGDLEDVGVVGGARGATNVIVELAVKGKGEASSCV